jgi:hypothetical protein
LTLASTSAWQTFADLLDPPENPYVRDPVGWVTNTWASSGGRASGAWRSQL